MLPLALADGAGSGVQNAIGTGVVGGTIAGTVQAVFFVPLLFVVVIKMFTRKQPGAKRVRELLDLAAEVQ